MHEAKDRNLIWKHSPPIEDAEPFMNGKDINLYYRLFSRVVFERYQCARSWVFTQGLYCTTCNRFSHSCWEAQCCNVKGMLQFYRDDFVCNRKHLLIWIFWCVEFLGIIITRSVYSTQWMSAYSWVGNVKGVVHNTNIHCMYSSWHVQKQYWAGLRKQTVLSLCDHCHPLF